MKRALALRLFVAAACALALAVGAQKAASAQGRGPAPGAGQRTMALAGVVSDVEARENGDLVVTLGRQGREDARFLVTGETRVVPSGETPEVGDAARAVVRVERGEGADRIPVAVTLNLAGEARPPQPGRERIAVRLHGTIAALPDDPHDGVWTVTVPGVADCDLLVDRDTKITPPDVAPEVGQEIAFTARQTEQGWLALAIQLEPRAGLGEGRTPRPAMVVLRGTVADLPEDRSGEWTLVVAVAGGADRSVLVTPDTVVDGELAVGAGVVVQAQARIEADGSRALVAKHIKVVEHAPAPIRDREPVRIVGMVTSVADDGSAWTIAPESGDPIVVAIDADTRIVGLAEGESPVGRQVRGSARQLDDGTLLARVLQVKAD